MLLLAQKYLYKTITIVSIFTGSLRLSALLIVAIFDIFIKMMQITIVRLHFK
ncbi:hypothetical protein HMPREF9184_00335 [Streptococcus sp. oral taxon 058 str. F0407]|nr:hypothetical protein HMPREF9184_00335 [Streptococcus sp. oral taxon 058 str. F0407]